MLRTKTALATLFAIGLGSWSQVAAAQTTSGTVDGFAVERFSPAPAGDRFFGAPSAYAGGHLDVHVMLMGDYAARPLALARPLGVGEVPAVVSDQLFMRLNGTLALWDRLQLNIDIPVAVFHDGDSPLKSGTQYTSPSDPAMGDLRFAARGTILGGYHDPLQLAVGANLWLPTGDEEAFTGEGGVSVHPYAVLGGWSDRIVYSLAFGPKIAPSTLINDVEIGTQLIWQGGVAVRLGDERRVQLGPEIQIAITPENVRPRNTNGEILLGAKYRVIDDLEVGIGAGPGFTAGYGTPDVRGVASIAYTPLVPEPDDDGDGVSNQRDLCPDLAAGPNPAEDRPGCPAPPMDRDRDGIADPVDACPDMAGVAQTDPAKSGCPADADGDGIGDLMDLCPNEPMVGVADPARPGCPPPVDTDKDGIADPADACPDKPGVANADATQNGCPPDTDGDGIRDDLDACPAEKGVADADPKQNGCKKSVRVMGDEIVILQQVQFETGTAKIKTESDGLLGEVADVLKEHPEILKLEVGGHTDNRGPAYLNKKLSQDRADSVRKSLVGKGIEEGRLTAKGYGPDKPLGDNKTDEGRAKNRRVQFQVLERRK